MTEIRLTEQEVRYAASVGIERELQYRFNCNWEHKDKRPLDVGWQSQVEGACGELAFAKALNCYYVPTVGTFKSVPDVAGYEVRTRSKDHYGLLLRVNDALDRPYVLVTGQIPHFKIWGWRMGRDIKALGTLMDPGNDGRPPFYVLDDKSLLHDLDVVPVVSVVGAGVLLVVPRGWEN